MRSSYDRYRKSADIAYVGSNRRAVEVRCSIGNRIGIKRLKGRAARYHFSLDNAVVLPGNKSFALPLFLYWYGDYDRSKTVVPSTGETWVFKGRVYCSKKRGYRSSLLLNSGEMSSRRCSSADTDNWRKRLVSFRNDASRRITYGIENWRNVVHINQAVLLGFRENIPRNLKKVFACSGTVHVFAISGLHIALIASVLVFIVSACGVPRYCWIFILAPLLLVYAFATGMRPSAVRATLMAILFFAAPFLGRHFNALSALTCAAIIVHIVSPIYIDDIGSILSFSVMLGLVVLFKPMCTLFEMLFRVNSFKSDAVMYAAAAEEKLALWKRRIAYMLSCFAGLCAVTVAAWLSSMPLCACFFGRITPGGLIANLVISPCALMLVISGVLGFSASFFSLFLAGIFNNAAAFFTFIMIKTAEFISGCPGSNFKVSSFPAWVVWSWFGLLFFAAWLLRRWSENKNEGLEWMEKK
ncbi:MAG: ComEC/Rec2 family competence protein [Kiritimatiellia bacterium]